MKKNVMTSMERVLTTLSHQEPDQVPLFLLLTMHGAKELDLSIEEYFSNAKNVIEGQIRMQKKYKNDCFYPFFYAPIEIEAFGGEVMYSKDGPPNSAEPFLQTSQQIKELGAPKIADAKSLHKVLKTIEALKEKAKGEIPIIGVAMSPFSLPVMQLGFQRYLEIMHFEKDLFNHLMKVNIKFCTDWANAQLKAGATAICYFDPISSSTIIPRDLYLNTGFKIAQETIAALNGPTATHFASGNCLPIAEDVSQTGTAVVGVSTGEDLLQLKDSFRNKLTILGNLNGIEMRRWTEQETVSIVKEVIGKAAPGGGFILSDNHGEIPYQVSDSTLKIISDTVNEFGRYPIQPF